MDKVDTVVRNKDVNRQDHLVPGLYPSYLSQII